MDTVEKLLKKINELIRTLDQCVRYRGQTSPQQLEGSPEYEGFYWTTDQDEPDKDCIIYLIDTAQGSMVAQIYSETLTPLVEWKGPFAGPLKIPEWKK